MTPHKAERYAPRGHHAYRNEKAATVRNNGRETLPRVYRGLPPVRDEGIYLEYLTF